MDTQVTERAKELYDEIMFGHLGYNRAEYNPLLYDFLSKVKDNDTLFDIGCGSGYWMEEYIKYGISQKQITGIDISPAVIENLKKRGFNAYYGNVLDLDIKDNLSNFTICNGVIHHTYNPFQAFKEIVRITKPLGYIYLSVYNQWNPYYYLVHKATYPIRYIYWNYNKKIVDCIYPVAKNIFQPLALLMLGKALDDQVARNLFMDQVITQRAYLFSKTKILSYAYKCNCEIISIKYTNQYFMVTAIIRKRD